MRKSVLILAALLLAIVIPRQARASDDVQYIVITTGTQTVAVALNDNPVITYANDQLVIATTEKLVEVPVAEITGYGFTEEAPTAIRSIETGLRHKQGMIAFDSLKRPAGAGGLRRFGVEGPERVHGAGVGIPSAGSL